MKILSKSIHKLFLIGCLIVIVSILNCFFFNLSLPVELLCGLNIAGAETTPAPETIQHSPAKGEEKSDRAEKGAKEEKSVELQGGAKDLKDPKSEGGAKDDTEGVKADDNTTVSEAPLVQPEDIQAVMNTLEKKRKSLQEEEARIKKERSDLESLKQEITDKIAELTVVQNKIEEELNRKAEMTAQEAQKKDEAEIQRIKNLVKVYGNMKPKSAAEILDKMDMNIVLQVLKNMKGEQIGQILTYVAPDRAAKISEWLATKEK